METGAAGMTIEGTTMGRIWMALGGLAGAGAVAMSAVAAHALPQRLDAKALGAVQSAIQMQGWHALALVLTGLWVMRAPLRANLWTARLSNAAGAGFTLGILLFCGAIYASHLTGIHAGPAAPTGGMLLILAWLCLAASALASGPTP
jgi:uncharacterized membrane protein YgdD (TMEM256/DUF423 family)